MPSFLLTEYTLRSAGVDAQGTNVRSAVFALPHLESANADGVAKLQSALPCDPIAR